MKRHLKRALELLFVPIAAAIVFFEEVLLHYLGVAMAALARLPWVARLEAWLAGLPPWAALVAFVAPSTLVLPVKLAAVWFALHGQFALATRLHRHRQDRSPLLWLPGSTRCCGRPCSAFPGTSRAETWLFAWRDRVYDFVRALPLWQAAVAASRQARAWLAALVSRAASR